MEAPGSISHDPTTIVKEEVENFVEKHLPTTGFRGLLFAASAMTLCSPKRSSLAAETAGAGIDE